MKIVPIADLKARLSEYIAACKTEPVIVTKNGRVAAMLIPASDKDDLEDLIIAHSPVFRELIRKSRQAETTPHDEFWKRVEEKNK